MEVVCTGLAGQKYIFIFPPTTTIGKILWEIGSSGKLAPIEQLKFVHNGRYMETLGLNRKIIELAENNIVKICYTLRLSAAPYSLGKARKSYWLFVVNILKSGTYNADTDQKIDRVYKSVVELEELYRRVNQMTAANDVDPITKKPVEQEMSWIETNGNKYSVNYESLLKYLRTNSYSDSNRALQIPSPFTGLDIPEPWRTDFLEIINY